MKQESNWKRCVLSSFAVAAMLSGTAIDTARGDHAAAFVPHFAHAPTDPMDGIVEVTLQNDGTWGAAKSDSVFWRFALGVEKSPLVSVPPLGPTVNGAVTVRMQGTSPTVPCTGKICELELAGKVHWDVVTNMLVNAAMPSPKHETLDASLGVVFGSGSKFPATACQIRRQEELAKGKSLNQVLSEGVTYPSKALAMMYTSGQDGSSHNWAWPSPWNTEIEVPITIRCIGNPEIADKIDPPPPGDIVAGLQVTSAMLAILPNAKTETACPVDVAFIGRIYASGAVGPTEVKYRFEFATGQKSTEFSTTLQPGAEYANVSHQVTIPLTAAILDQPGGGAGGGGGVGLGGQGGLAAVQKPDDDFPGNPKPKPFGLKGEGLPSNEHKNDVRLRVLSHGGGKVVSNSAGYHIVCEPKAAIQPVGPMTAPTKPEPPAQTGPVIVTPAPVSPPKPAVVIDPPRTPQLVCTGGRVRGKGARATCVCPRGQERRDLGRNRFRCERPVVQVTCRGGTVRGNDCVCARTLRKVQTGANAWRCDRPAAKSARPSVKPPATVPTRVTCAGGSVRGGSCVCSRGMQRVSAGAPNSWRCVATRPARGSSATTLPARRAR